MTEKKVYRCRHDYHTSFTEGLVIEACSAKIAAQEYAFYQNHHSTDYPPEQTVIVSDGKDVTSIWLVRLSVMPHYAATEIKPAQLKGTKT